MSEACKIPILVRIAICAVAALLLNGQQITPVFRSGAKLVAVDVTVLDKKGNAVTRLSAADFTILDDGKPRPVVFFRFDDAHEADRTDAPAPLPHGTFSNQPVVGASEAQWNIAALVLDTLNTPQPESVKVRSQMMRYLMTLAPRSRVAVFAMGEQLRVLHDFTDDAAALRAKLETAALGMPAGKVSDYSQSVAEAEAFVNLFAFNAVTAMMDTAFARQGLKAEAFANAATRRQRMELTLAAMETLGAHLAGIPGRKSVVWIGAGFSMQSADSMTSGGGVEDYTAKVRQVAQRLAQQGIILYIVDSKAIVLPTEASPESKTSLPRSFGRFEQEVNTEALNCDPRPAMELMAAVTGGRYFHNTNDLAAGFKQTAIDLQGSYELGFYMPEEADNKWHKLKVHVKGAGLTVLHREGYRAQSVRTQPEPWAADKWRSALAGSIASTAIPLTVQCERVASGELALTILADGAALELSPEGEHLKADLEIGIANRLPDGSTAAQAAVFPATVRTASGDTAGIHRLSYGLHWKPIAGTASLRIVVHDTRGGQYGSLEVPLRDIAGL